MCVRERDRERQREREKERRTELQACLASFRLCNVSAASGSDGRELQLFCSIMSAFCLITAHLQPGRRCTQPVAGWGFGGGGARENCTYKPLFGLGQKMQRLKKKKGFYYLEPITIIMSPNPTIVQVFPNRGSFSQVQPLAPKNANIW